MQKSEDEVVVIRRYGNRRLYDTRASVYVNLADVRALVRDGRRIQVLDANTEEDVTRRVLTQIVLETADERGLPLDLLYELVRASDRAFRDFLDWYLKSSIEVYRRLQESWQVDARRRWGDARPTFEAWAQLWDPRQVAASLAQILSPFERRPGASAAPAPASGAKNSRRADRSKGSREVRPEGASAAAPPPDEAASPARDEIDDLRRRLDELEQRLAANAAPSGAPAASRGAGGTKPRRS